MTAQVMRMTQANRISPFASEHPYDHHAYGTVNGRGDDHVQTDYHAPAHHRGAASRRGRALGAALVGLGLIAHDVVHPAPEPEPVSNPVKLLQSVRVGTVPGRRGRDDRRHHHLRVRGRRLLGGGHEVRRRPGGGRTAGAGEPAVPGRRQIRLRPHRACKATPGRSRST